MSDETQAPEATTDALAADVTINAPAATPDVPVEHESLLEKVEDVVGGILGDHPRKPQAAPHEVQAIQAGEALITREQLDEIEKRGAVGDIRTLVTACRALLDELEAAKAGS